MPEYRIDPATDGTVTVFRDGEPLVQTAPSLMSTATNMRLATRIAGILQLHDQSIAALLDQPGSSVRRIGGVVIHNLPQGNDDPGASTRAIPLPTDLKRRLERAAALRPAPDDAA